MFCSARKDRNSKRGLMRRILVEQLENRKLMAFDVSSFNFEPTYWESDTTGFGVVSDFNPVMGFSRSAPISFELDTDNLPEGVAFGKSIMGDATSDVSNFEWTVDSSTVKSIASKDADVSEFAPISFELDTDNLPEGVAFGKSIMGDATADVSNFEWTVDSSTVKSIASKDADVSEFAPISFELDTDNLPEGVAFGKSIMGDATADVSNFEWTVDSSTVKSIASKDADVSEFAPISFELDTDNLPEGVTFGKSIIGDATSDVSNFEWTVDSSTVKSIASKDADVSEFAPISFELDADNLPEGVAFGRSIMGDATADVSNFEWTVDSSTVKSIASKDADVSEFAPISFELDADNLPEGVAFGRSIIGDATSDVSNFEWTVDSSTVKSIASQDADVSEFAPISFELDTDNLPEGVAFGRSIIGDATSDVSNFEWTVDSSTVKSIASQDADVSEFAPTSFELDTDNQPKDIAFGESILGDQGDAIAPSTGGMMEWIGESIVVDGANLAEVMPVPAELIAKFGTQSIFTRKVTTGGNATDKEGQLTSDQSGAEVGIELSGVLGVPAALITWSGDMEGNNEDVIFGESIHSDKGDVVAPIADGMMEMWIGESIVVDGADLASVVPVPAELIATSSKESVVTGKVKVGDKVTDVRGEVTRTPSGASREVGSKVERKLPDSAKAWFGQSIQRKRTGESLRNQLVDTALIELLGS